jgi:hypothetical protein
MLPGPSDGIFGGGSVNAIAVRVAIADVQGDSRHAAAHRPVAELATAL